MASKKEIKSITKELNQLEKTLEKLEKSVKSFPTGNDKIESQIIALTKLQRLALYAGEAIADLSVESAKMSNEFTKNFSLVESALEGHKEKIKEAREGILSLSSTYGVSTQEMTHGLLSVMNTLGANHDNVRQLETITKPALASGSSMGDVLGFLSTATRTFGILLLLP